MNPTVIRRAAIANLGCKVNQAEMDSFERLLRSRGVEIVGEHASADLVLINTCTVTSMADQKSRQAVRRARRTSPDARIVVTGCSVAIDPDALAEADPEAQLFDNEWKSDGRLMAELSCLPAGPAVDGSAAAVSELDRTRAFVKIQDGCSLHCTYCIIARARGPERSVLGETALAAVHDAVVAGYREAVLTGINVGAYDGGDGLSLAGLVRRILDETDVERIRLSSIEPQHVTDELLDVWRGSSGRCLPHFHISLQSGDDTILRRMGRRYDTAYYRDVVARVRRAIPDVAVHADLIVGFPGEDEAAWAGTMAFVRGLDLAGVHVFRYSARPGTAAARMVGQVDSQTMKRRAAEGLALAAAARVQFARAQLGRDLRVLFERPRSDRLWVGHAEGHVLVEVPAVPGQASLWNAVAMVRAERVRADAEDRIVGRLVADPPGRKTRRLPGSREPLAESARK